MEALPWKEAALGYRTHRVAVAREGAGRDLRRHRPRLFTLFALIGAAAGVSSDPETAWITPLFGVAAIVVFPLLYGAIAFVMGLLVSGLYNLIAARVGGIEITLGGGVTGA